MLISGTISEVNKSQNTLPNENRGVLSPLYLNPIRLVSLWEGALKELSFYLNTKDIFQLLPAFGKKPYNELIKPQLREVGPSLINHSIQNIKSTLSSLISKHGLTTYQEELRSSINQKIEDLHSFREGISRKEMESLLAEYLFTLSNETIDSILGNYGNLSLFFRKKHLKSTKELVYPTPSLENRLESAKDEISQGFAQATDLTLLRAASLSLERQQRYEEQLALNQKIHQEFIQTTPQSIEDKLQLILLGRKDLALEENQTLDDFFVLWASEMEQTLTPGKVAVIRLLSENKVQDALDLFSSSVFGDQFNRLLSVECICVSRVDCAYKIAQRIGYYFEKFLVCFEFVNAGAFEEAYKTAETLGEGLEKLRVGVEFIKAGAFVLAYKLAKGIEEDRWKAEICNEFIMCGAFALAFKLAKTLGEDVRKREVCDEFIKAGAFDLAFKLAKTIQSEREKLPLCANFLYQWRFKEAFEIEKRNLMISSIIISALFLSIIYREEK